MLDLKRLRVLREVAHEGSFSAAGEKLGYTQSAVSQQIAALERETGSTLVERSARGVRLTDTGRALVEHADGILARVSAAEDELEAIAGLSRSHPGVELSLIEAEPEQAIPQLKAGELDVALIFEYSSLRHSQYQAEREDVERVHLLDAPMSVALPPDHPAAKKRNLRLADLSG